MENEIKTKNHKTLCLKYLDWFLIDQLKVGLFWIQRFFSLVRLIRLRLHLRIFMIFQINLSCWMSFKTLILKPFFQMWWGLLWEKTWGFWVSSFSYYIGKCLPCEKIIGFELKISFQVKNLCSKGWFTVFFILTFILLSYLTYWDKTQDSSHVDSRRGWDQNLEWISSVFMKKKGGSWNLKILDKWSERGWKIWIR